MNKRNFWSKYGRLLILIGIIILIIFLVWKSFGSTIPDLLRLLKEGKEEAIQDYIAQKSAWQGVFTMILLSFLQVISIVFPGFVVQLAAGLIYGWWKAFIMCYCGFVAANLVVFSFARHAGKGIMNILPEKNREKSNLLLEKLKTERPTMVVGLANLLPIVPNGIIPYVAAQSPISFRGYAKAIALTSWIQVFFNCIAGHFLIRGMYIYTFLAIAVQIVILLLVAWKRAFIMKTIDRVFKKKN